MDCTNKALQTAGQKKLRVIYGDCTLGVHGSAKGKAFHYIFSYQTGGLESINIEGREWLYRTSRPTFWRALTDNDRGSGFHLKSGTWMSADLFMGCVKIEVSADGKSMPLPIAPENNKFGGEAWADNISIAFTYETITSPKTNVEVVYKVDLCGKIHVVAEYKGKEGLPELPVFGMRFIMPTKAAGYRYEGLSGETYPDRKAGGRRGIYDVEGLPVTPYLVPQDCGMHMDTSWVEIRRNTVLDNTMKTQQEFSLKITAADEDFAFSCLPYTAQELENATHQEELPPARRTVLCIYGAVRGVGGIDSWRTDVEEAYRVSAEQDIRFTFDIVL
ncbi:MAG: beta-galactosidase small subunit [Lachnospiraceae bacterium]|nr:beta-galactosidase small subunit [Lachnospiraceae bacterium]